MVCFRRKYKKVYTSVIWMLITAITHTKVNNGQQNNSSALRIWMAQKSENVSSVDTFIKQKVKELKPYLEDDTVENVVEDDKITLEGDDETTIIEFNPNVRSIKRDEEAKAVENKVKDFQENLQKYKKLRSKIRKALKREKVTNKTKSLVTKTLDKMIAQMIAHRCSWSNNIQYRGMMGNDTNKNHLNDVVRSWYAQWSKLKHQFKAKEDDREGVDEEMSKDKFLEKFQDLMFIMSNDLNAVAGKYKVVCRYEDKKGNIKTADRNIIRTDQKKQKIQDDKYLKIAAENAVINNNYEDTLPCSNVKICSEELTEFLLNFYITFNDTAVNVITNYAAMFLRDVSDDSYHEKERVVKLIMNVAKTAEKKAESIYKKQTKRLGLSRDKNPYKNLKNLYEYVTKTLERFKNIIHKEVETNLKSVREKLMHIIQTDIDVNMALDLNNLERDVTAGICHIFAVCNGVVIGRRKTNYVGDKSNVYVKVQVKLDDDEKNEKATLKIKEREFPLKYGIARTTPTINKLILKIEPSLDRINNNDIILSANPIIVSDTKDVNSRNNNTIINPNIDQEVLGTRPHFRSDKTEKEIKNINPEDVKVKIMFIEETKNENVASKRKLMKHIKLKGLRKTDFMLRLAMNLNEIENVTVDNITDDINENIV